MYEVALDSWRPGVDWAWVVRELSRCTDEWLYSGDQ